MLLEQLILEKAKKKTSKATTKSLTDILAYATNRKKSNTGPIFGGLWAGWGYYNGHSDSDDSDGGGDGGGGE